MSSIKAEKLICRDEYTRRGGHAVEGISLSVPKGEFLCLLGAAGAGKSRLMHKLSGISGLESGELYISGLDCRDADRQQEIRQRCALVPERAEDKYLFTSVQAELSFASRNFKTDEAETEKRMKEALSLVGLDAYEKSSVPLLSSFERYCLAIAAALVQEPEILFVDAFAEGYDLEERRKASKILKDIHESGKTVIYSTRNPQDALMAQRLIIVQDGGIAADDNPVKLLSDAKLLSGSRLELPFTVRVYCDLLEAGAELGRCPLDIDELVEEVCR